jgi:hypothetical protein
VTAALPTPLHGARRLSRALPTSSAASATIVGIIGASQLGARDVIQTSKGARFTNRLAAHAAASRGATRVATRTMSWYRDRAQMLFGVIRTIAAHDPSSLATSLASDAWLHIMSTMPMWKLDRPAADVESPSLDCDATTTPPYL